MGMPRVKQNRVRSGEAKITDAETSFHPTLFLAEKWRL
jgi:hypothetical protein